jgi:hypothetical protein
MLANALPFEWECPRFAYVVRFPGNSLQAVSLASMCGG